MLDFDSTAQYIQTAEERKNSRKCAIGKTRPSFVFFAKHFWQVQAC